MLGVGGNAYWRLNQDGSFDETFQSGRVPDSETSSHLTSVSVQADGKVLIWGHFFEVQGFLQPGLARLNNDGSVDTSFAPAMRLSHAVADRWGRVLGVPEALNAPAI